LGGRCLKENRFTRKERLLGQKKLEKKMAAGRREGITRGESLYHGTSPSGVRKVPGNRFNYSANRRGNSRNIYQVIVRRKTLLVQSSGNPNLGKYTGSNPISGEMEMTRIPQKNNLKTPHRLWSGKDLPPDNSKLHLGGRKVL